MKGLKRQAVICFDVDDTLVMYGYTKEFIENYKSKGLEEISIKCNEFNTYTIDHLFIHKFHVERLKEIKKNGAFIIVWSKGGGTWAEKVVKALKLEKYVDMCMNKPMAHFDDQEAKFWMGKHKYMNPITGDEEQC